MFQTRQCQFEDLADMGNERFQPHDHLLAKALLKTFPKDLKQRARGRGPESLEYCDSDHWPAGRHGLSTTTSKLTTTWSRCTVSPILPIYSGLVTTTINVSLTVGISSLISLEEPLSDKGSEGPYGQTHAQLQLGNW